MRNEESFDLGVVHVDKGFGVVGFLRYRDTP